MSLWPPDPAVRALTVLAAAWVVDQTMGEYPTAIHPVVWIGQTISFLARVAGVEREAVRVAPRATFGAAPSHLRRARELVAGGLIAVAVPTLAAGATWALLRALGRWPLPMWVAEVLLLKSTFALRELGRAADRVSRALGEEDLTGARVGLMSLCSRDPSALRSEDLVAATIESVSENLSDSVVAPLLFFAAFGVPGAMAYRAVNTLDAMIGYRGRFEYLGKASARLDDLLNWIPARLTAAALLLAGPFGSVARGAAIWSRDARLTASPNAGHPMAAMAGLLGVRLSKEGCYALGEGREPLSRYKITQAWGIVYRAAALTFIAVGLLAFGSHRATAAGGKASAPSEAWTWPN